MADNHQISNLVHRILGYFRTLGESVRTNLVRKALIESQSARFHLWARNLGAYREFEGYLLDYRLRAAPSLRKHVFSLLKKLKISIKRACQMKHEGFILPEEPVDPIDKDLASYFLGDDGLNQPMIDLILKDIVHLVDCLLRLSIAIANSSPYDEFQYDEHDIRVINYMFPHLSHGLVERLAKATAWRRQYMKYLKSFCSWRPGGSWNRATPASDLGNVSKVVSPASLSNEPNSLDDARAVPSWPCIPLLPNRSIGRYIFCELCFSRIKMNSQGDWKKHVLQDLRPYICLESCPVAYHQFSHPSDWAHHMEQVHWKQWHCALGCPVVFDSDDEWQRHMISVHDKDFSESNPEDRNTWKRYKFRQVEGNCPICCSEQIESVDQYYSHIGNHLEQLSPLSLRCIDVDEIRMNQNTDSEMESAEEEGEVINESEEPPEDFGPGETHGGRRASFESANQERSQGGSWRYGDIAGPIQRYH